MTQKNLTVRGWRDYELIDSGDNRKLERFGKFILIRPETQALWRPAQPGEWKRANAEFRFAGGKGEWHPPAGRKGEKSMPEKWELVWNDARGVLRLTSFKHVGIFPEQAANWEWIAERATAEAAPREVLNLFGYTGIASVVAAQAGAHVTHVDASRQSNEWAKENAKLSEVPAENIRYIRRSHFRGQSRVPFRKSKKIRRRSSENSRFKNPNPTALSRPASTSGL